MDWPPYTGWGNSATPKEGPIIKSKPSMSSEFLP